MIEEHDIQVIVRNQDGAQVIGFTRETMLPHLIARKMGRLPEESLKFDLTAPTCKFCGKSTDTLTMEISLITREGISLWSHLKKSFRAALGGSSQYGQTVPKLSTITLERPKRRFWRK